MASQNTRLQPVLGDQHTLPQPRAEGNSDKTVNVTRRRKKREARKINTKPSPTRRNDSENKRKVEQGTAKPN